MAEVILSGLTKIYDNKVKAVDQVDLSVKNKEFLVLVGPSGCGKTTILRMIAGLEQITDGEIFIDGAVVNEVPPKDRNTAMVFQNYALYPHMTVYQNISFGLKMAKTEKKEIDERVRRTAGMLSISGYLDRKPKALSGGQRQRVALARAIVKSPKVFLFDEPLSNLDAQLRTQTRAELKKLQQQLATTAIYVTHDRTEAMTLGDRIAVLKDGRLQQVDEPLAIYQRPQTLFVANFIGTPGINILEGEIRTENGGAVFVNGDIRQELPASSPKLGSIPKAFLGIRPEDLELVPDNDAGIKGQVDFVEQLGGESLIYLTAASGRKMVVKALGNLRYETGSNLKAAIKPKAIHLFDGQTERRIN
ncbi:sn-glycerol-3-phosphate ABC transporter ATP-binding protein UgpC [candidate division TA06 bacterium]|nr:sn-glycerol-3-phosphate ABC transporter ATP-binding protein UgpC [candidate division TA06 bacterium]